MVNKPLNKKQAHNLSVFLDSHLGFDCDIVVTKKIDVMKKVHYVILIDNRISFYGSELNKLTEGIDKYRKLHEGFPIVAFKMISGSLLELF